MFSHKADDLLCKATLHVIVGQYFNRLCSGIGRMDDEAAFRLALDVKRELQVLIFDRQLQTRKLRTQAGENVFLYLFLQFLARRSLERSDAGIGSVGNESTAGFGLNAICEMRDQAFEFHGSDCNLFSKDPILITMVLCFARQDRLHHGPPMINQGIAPSSLLSFCSSLTLFITICMTLR